MALEKFCLSYSTGKDSILAMSLLVQAGYQLTGLVTSLDETIERSWFHGVPRRILEQASQSLGVPLFVVANTPENYEQAMVEQLTAIQKAGTTAICFGDIDIEQNGSWDKKIATAAGLTPLLPLWQQERRKIVEQFLASGYTAIIKTVSLASGIPERFLGTPLNAEFLAYLAAHNLDLCGENGEYHTLVVDGPLFKKPLAYRTDGIFKSPYALSLIIY
jgi:uncharacterized protein (TIGR00290 family)